MIHSTESKKKKKQEKERKQKPKDKGDNEQKLHFGNQRSNYFSHSATAKIEAQSTQISCPQHRPV